MCTTEEATQGAVTVDEEKTEIYILLTPSTIAAGLGRARIRTTDAAMLRISKTDA